MKPIRLLLFLLQSVTLGLLLAFAWLWWQSGFDPQRLLARLAPASPPAAVTTAARLPRRSGPVSYAEAVRKSSPSVVTIYTRKHIEEIAPPGAATPAVPPQRRFKRERNETNLGSGVIVSRNGYILTNQHVIDGADEILVSLPDGRGSEARLIGQDRETDIAVLQIDLPELQPITVVDADSDIEVGDVVLAIGNPLNVGQTVTMGIISATGRNRIGLNTFENFIQTDAAINPGNSGGALVNANGDLIGINSAIFTQSGGSQGIGFAIPVSLALDIMKQLIENGKVTRGWLGIEGTEISARSPNGGLERIRGVLVLGVFVDSPADRAGVEPGDIIIAVNGKPVHQVRNVLEMIASHKPGDRVTLDLLRGKERLRLVLATTERPA
jgi:Do/DeqQ family serine protease